MFIFYNFIFFIVILLHFPYLLLKGKWHSGIWQRFHFTPSKDWSSRKDVIWLHAVSVGEVQTVLNLIERLKGEFEDKHIVLSTVTKTGYALAKSQLGSESTVIYAPLDFSWVVRQFIRGIKPRIYVATETEIWPNLYAALYHSSVPIIQINGRISDKAFEGYRRFGFLTKRILHCVLKFCMQSALDAERIIELGAEPQRVQVAGNLKFDGLMDFKERNQEEAGFSAEDELLVAGSTHPGEEELMIDTFKLLVGEFHDLRLVIAPRHIERVDEVIKIIQKAGLHPVRFSEIDSEKVDKKTIVVVDTIGQLRGMYPLAKVVFIGKTFHVGGGQNMIEPAACGKSVFVGPLTQNFKDVMSIFLKAQAITQVNTAKELLEKIQDHLRHPQRIEEMGNKAKAVVASQQGATERTIEVIKEMIG